MGRLGCMPRKKPRISARKAPSEPLFSAIICRMTAVMAIAAEYDYLLFKNRTAVRVRSLSKVAADGMAVIG
jgi:hypothetical protein